MNRHVSNHHCRDAISSTVPSPDLVGKVLDWFTDVARSSGGHCAVLNLLQSVGASLSEYIITFHRKPMCSSENRVSVRILCLPKDSEPSFAKAMWFLKRGWSEAHTHTHTGWSEKVFWTPYRFVMCCIVLKINLKSLSAVDFSGVTNIQPHPE